SAGSRTAEDALPPWRESPRACPRNRSFAIGGSRDPQIADASRGKERGDAVRKPPTRRWQLSFSGHLRVVPLTLRVVRLACRLQRARIQRWRTMLPFTKRPGRGEESDEVFTKESL